MLELLEDAKRERFQSVIIWKLNCLARNLIDQHKMLEIFKQHNIGWVSLTEPLETNSAQGTLWYI